MSTFILSAAIANHVWIIIQILLWPVYIYPLELTVNFRLNDCMHFDINVTILTIIRISKGTLRGTKRSIANLNIPGMSSKYNCPETKLICFSEKIETKPLPKVMA